MTAHRDMPAPKELAARLVPLLRRRRSLWLPDVYYEVGTLLKKLLEDTDRERFDYNGHYLQRVGKILRKECGAGTPVLHSALCLVKTIDREAFADFRAHHVSWTALRFVLRVLSKKCDDRPARPAEIRRQLKDYEPARFTAYVRELLPGEKAGKPPKKASPPMWSSAHRAGYIPAACSPRAMPDAYNSATRALESFSWAADGRLFSHLYTALGMSA